MTNMNVYIYPNTPKADPLALEAKSAISLALEFTKIHFEIYGDDGSYRVEIDYSYPRLIYNGDSSTEQKIRFKDYFEKWTVTNASGKGVHLLLSSEFAGGYADSGEWLESAWNDETEAVAGSVSGGGAHFRNICIQEAFHPFIGDNVPSAVEMMGPSGNEHTLGTVTSDSKQTPMVASYLDDGYAAEGECSGVHNSMPDYTEVPSECTSEAMRLTYKNQVRL